MVAEIWALVISPFVDQWVALNVFYIVVYLCRKPVYMYVLNFNDWVFFYIFYQMIVLCAVLFSVNIILRTTLEISVR